MFSCTQEIYTILETKKTPVKSKKSPIDRYIGEREFGKRIRLLYLEKSGVDWFYRSSRLSSGDVKEVEEKWSQRFTPLKYIYGYSIFTTLLVIVSWMITWTSAQIVSVLALVVLLLSGGVSAVLSPDNIEKLDSKFYNLIKGTKDSIVYFVYKDFVLSDKSTRIIQLERVTFTNLFFTNGIMLLFGLFSKLGAPSDTVNALFATLIDETLLSYGETNGWDIIHMIYYVLLGAFTASLTLTGELSVFKGGDFRTYFTKQNVWNFIVLIGYSILCYRRICLLEGFQFSSPKWDIVLQYWGVFVLGLQMFFAVLFHQFYTVHNWLGKKSNSFYYAVLVMLTPYFLVGVLGLQVLPGIVIIALCYGLLWLFKFARFTLKVSSAIKVIGYFIGILVAIYNVIKAFNLF